jgi:carbon monoxide dehydrogenase subunit G
MIVEARMTMKASRAKIWAALTDIENAARIVSGIEKIEIVGRPAKGLIGLKWRETRILYGKPATVEKTMVEAVENQFYRTRAEDGGFLFVTTKTISEGDGGMTVTECHETRPQTLAARLMSIPMVVFKGVIRKAALQDLADIKVAVEKP